MPRIFSFWNLSLGFRTTRFALSRLHFLFLLILTQILATSPGQTATPWPNSVPATVGLDRSPEEKVYQALSNYYRYVLYELERSVNQTELLLSTPPLESEREKLKMDSSIVSIIPFWKGEQPPGSASRVADIDPDLLSWRFPWILNNVDLFISTHSLFQALYTLDIWAFPHYLSDSVKAWGIRGLSAHSASGLQLSQVAQSALTHYLQKTEPKRWEFDLIGEALASIVLLSALSPSPTESAHSSHSPVFSLENFLFRIFGRNEAGLLNINVENLKRLHDTFAKKLHDVSSREHQLDPLQYKVVAASSFLTTTLEENLRFENISRQFHENLSKLMSLLTDRSTSFISEKTLVLRLMRTNLALLQSQIRGDFSLSEKNMYTYEDSHLAAKRFDTKRYARYLKVLLLNSSDNPVITRSFPSLFLLMEAIFKTDYSILGDQFPEYSLLLNLVIEDLSRSEMGEPRILGEGLSPGERATILAELLTQIRSFPNNLRILLSSPDQERLQRLEQRAGDALFHLVDTHPELGALRDHLQSDPVALSYKIQEAVWTRRLTSSVRSDLSLPTQYVRCFEALSGRSAQESPFMKDFLSALGR